MSQLLLLKDGGNITLCTSEDMNLAAKAYLMHGENTFTLRGNSLIGEYSLTQPIEGDYHLVFETDSLLNSSVQQLLSDGRKNKEKRLLTYFYRHNGIDGVRHDKRLARNLREKISSFKTTVEAYSLVELKCNGSTVDSFLIEKTKAEKFVDLDRRKLAFVNAIRGRIGT